MKITRKFFIIGLALTMAASVATGVGVGITTGASEVSATPPSYSAPLSMSEEEIMPLALDHTPADHKGGISEWEPIHPEYNSGAFLPEIKDGTKYYFDDDGEIGFEGDRYGNGVTICLNGKKVASSDTLTIDGDVYICDCSGGSGEIEFNIKVNGSLTLEDCRVTGTITVGDEGKLTVSGDTVIGSDSSGGVVLSPNGSIYCDGLGQADVWIDDSDHENKTAPYVDADSFDGASGKMTDYFHTRNGNALVVYGISVEFPTLGASGYEAIYDGKDWLTQIKAGLVFSDANGEVIALTEGDDNDYTIIISSEDISSSGDLTEIIDAGTYTVTITLTNRIYTFGHNGVVDNTDEKQFVLAEAVARVTVGEETTGYGSIETAWAAAKGKTATVTLMQTTSASDALTVSTSDNITLELGGKALTASINVTGGTFVIDGAGTLTGNVDVTGGEFTLQGTGKLNGGVTVSGESAHFNMTGGTITNKSGAGVNMTGGTFTMSGGAIKDCVTTGDGVFTWGGGKIGTVYLGTGMLITVQSGFTALDDGEKIAIEIQAALSDDGVQVLDWEAGTDDPTAYFKSAIEAACYFKNTGENAAFIGKHSIVKDDGDPKWSGYDSVTFSGIHCEHEGCGKTSGDVTLTEGNGITSEETQELTCTQDGKTSYTAEVSFDKLNGGLAGVDGEHATMHVDPEMNVKTTPADGHSWEYTAAGAVLTATCGNDEHDSEKDGIEQVVTATLHAPETTTYTGEWIEATVTFKGGTSFPGGCEIKHYQNGGSSGYTEAVGGCIAAGSYQARLTAKGDTASEKATATLDFTIGKATLTITLSATVEYGEAVNTQEDVVKLSIKSGLVASDNRKKEAILAEAREKAEFNFGSYAPGTGVGKYKVTAGEVDITNYTVTFESADENFTVTSREIMVTLTFHDKTYGENPEGWVTAEAIRYGVGNWYAPGDATRDDDFHIFIITYSLQGAKGGAPLKYPTATTPADTYTIKATWTNENYEVTIEYGTDGAKYKITPAKLTVTANKKTITYGQTPSGTIGDVTITGFKNGEQQSDVVHGDVTITYSYMQYENVGTYDITVDVRGLSADNYIFSFDAESGKDKLTVEQAELHVDWSGKEVGYSYTYGSVTDPSATATGEGDDTFTFDVEMTHNPDGEGTTDFEDVGTYTFKAKVGAADTEKAKNYKILGDTQEYTIEQATNGWEEALDIQNWTYGEEAKAPSAKANFGDVEFSYSVKDGDPVDGVPKDAGTYIVTATVKDNKNYKGIEATKEFTINRANLTAGLSASVVYGDEINESNVTVTVKADELKNGDQEADIRDEAFRAAEKFFRYGGYTAGTTGVTTPKTTVSVSKDGSHVVDIKNYRVTFGDGKITVTARQIRVELSGDRLNTYGDKEHGQIIVKAVRDGKPEDNWYGNSSDEALLEEELVYTFYVSGQDASGATAYTPKMAASDYTIVAALRADGTLIKNYELVGAEGTEYKVNRKDLTVTLTASVVYGDDIDENNVTLTYESGLVDGDIRDDILAEAKVAADFGDYGGYQKGETGVGDTVTVTSKPKDITNYTVTYDCAEGNLTISPRKVTVTVGGTLKHTYGVEPTRPAFEADGATLPTFAAERADGKEGAWYGNENDIQAFENGAVYSLEKGGSRVEFNAKAPAGTYTLTLKWDNGNYEVTADGVSYTVEKADLHVTLEAAVTYGEGTDGITVTVTVKNTDELKNGDDRADIEAAAKDAAELTDFGGYEAGTPVSETGITVKAEGTLPNYNVTYESAAGNLTIKQREITVVNESAESGVYTGHGQPITVSFNNLYGGDGEFAPVTDYTIQYTLNGEKGSLEKDSNLPLTVGNYYAEVTLLPTSAKAANYTIVNDRQFGYEITPAKITEDFTKGFEKDRNELYSADESVKYPLGLPAQDEEDFPLVLQGNDTEIVNKVTLQYIVLSHKEGEGHAQLAGEIAGYLKQLEDGATQLKGQGYVDHVDPVREPMGYCVFFKAEADNHETYYGYFTLHIYHERLTIKMAAGGLTFTSKYGDVPHTEGTLFDLVFEKIESITATTTTEGDEDLHENKKAQFEKEKTFFHFYFSKDGTEYAVADLLSVGTYTLNVRYSKTGAESEEKYIEFAWDGGKAPTMEVTPRALTLTLGGTKTHEYGADTFGSIVATAACQDAPNSGANGEGLVGKDTVAGLGLTYTFTLGEQKGLSLNQKMGVGKYTIEADCANGNYTIAELKDAEYEVTPKDLYVEVNAEVVYGDELKKDNVKVEITGGLTSWDEDERETLAGEAYEKGNFIFDNYTKGTTPAGDEGVTVRADSVAVGNYTVIYTQGKITVAKRTIKVTLGGDRTNTYGAEEHGTIAPGAVRADAEGNKVDGDWYGNAGDTLNFTYRFQAAGKEAAEYSRMMRVDTYTIVIVWGNENYDIVALEGAEYTVTQATLTYDTPVGGQYDKQAHPLLETLAGVAGETLHRGMDYDVFYGDDKYDGSNDSILPKDAGRYEVRIELTGEAKNNYVLAADKGSFLYVIAQRELAKPTGSDTAYDYNGFERVLTVNGFDGDTMTATGDNVKANTANIAAINAGTYTVTITIKDDCLKNYCWVGGAQDTVSFTLTISPVDLVKDEAKFDALDRDYLYNSSGETHDLAMPNQSSEDFPFTVPGGGHVTVYYIVTEHADGDKYHDEDEIKAYLKELSDGEHSELWLEADAAMRVNTPKGYCVYFKIVDEAGNHNTYYGYYSVHIYHEEITIYLDDEIVNGHYNVEYGDASHTQGELRERLYKHILRVTAGKNPEEGEKLEGELDERYFNFYLIDEAGEEHYLEETDSGDRLPVGEYTIGVRYLETGEKARYIRLNWHDETPPDFEIIPRKIDLTATFEGHTYGATPQALAAQVALSAVRSGGKEGNWSGKSGETFASLNLTYSLASFGEHMDAGRYNVEIDCGNPNYDVTVVSATYIVYPRTLTADFGAYGDLTYGGANAPEASIRDGGILWDDDVELSIVSYEGAANGGTPYEGSELPTLAGTYTVTVVLTGAQKDNYALIVYTHDFTIKRAVYDMDGVTFADGTFKGDGSAHGLAATGIPDGISVSYTGNGMTEPGIYEVVAHFTGDPDNYEAIPARRATLTVLRMRIQSYLEGEHEQGAAPDVVVESTNGLDPTLELRMQASGQEVENAVKSSEAYEGGLAGVYDLGLYKDDTKVEPQDAFTVRLLIPENLRGKDFTVFSVQGGEVTEIEYTVDGDYIVITANSLASIAFTYANVSLILPIIIVATVLLLGIIALAFEIKSMKEKRKLG